MTPQELATHILQLTARDLAELNHLLRDLPGWGTSGVREPRRPRPESPGDTIAVDTTEGEREIR